MPALIDLPQQLDNEQTIKAVRALQAHLASRKTTTTGGKQNLLANDDSDSEGQEANAIGAADPDMAMWLQVTTKKFITDQKRLKPGKIVLPNPLLTLSPTLTICLIVKDPSAEFKALIPKLHLPTPTTLKITSPTSLKGKYRTYEARRQLERAHDIFLADDRIVSLLPGLLGKSIYKRISKIPIPINISGKESNPAGLRSEIEKALAATYLHLSPATCHAIRVGVRTMAPEKIAENVQAVVAKLVAKYVPQGFDGLKGLHIKAAETVALPIWLTDTLYSADDVLPEEEVKAIAFGKTEEGRKVREQKKKEARKARREEWAEKKKNRRNWDSDVEEDGGKPAVMEVAGKAGTKRKAEPISAPAEPAKTATEATPVVAKKRKVVETATAAVPATATTTAVTKPAEKEKKEKKSKDAIKPETKTEDAKTTKRAPETKIKSGKTKKSKMK